MGCVPSVVHPGEDQDRPVRPVSVLHRRNLAWGFQTSFNRSVYLTEGDIRLDRDFGTSWRPWYRHAQETPADADSQVHAVPEVSGTPYALKVFLLELCAERPPMSQLHPRSLVSWMQGPSSNGGRARPHPHPNSPRRAPFLQPKAQSKVVSPREVKVGQARPPNQEFLLPPSQPPVPRWLPCTSRPRAAGSAAALWAPHPPDWRSPQVPA